MQYPEPQALPFSKLAKVLSVLLVGIILLQPVVRVSAADEEAAVVDASSEVSEESVSIPSVSIPVEEPVPEPTVAIADVLDNGVVDEELPVVPVSADEVPADTTDVDAVIDDSTAVTSAVGSTTDEAIETPYQNESEPSEDLEVATSTEAIDLGVDEMGTSSAEDSAASSTATDTVDAPLLDDEVPLVDPVATSTAIDETIATTTDNLASTTEVLEPGYTLVENDSNRFQFGVDDCVTVENGFFYCTKDTSASVEEDGVYAAQDQDGDLEIFVRKGGVVVQLTHNLYDDTAPYYDAEADRMVWHALINDRYQIMMYDFKNESQSQLTDDNFNSMEPVVRGDAVVWQSWINDNWEIVMDVNGARTQLTSNTTHDIDPNIRGDVLSWQFLDGDVWHIKVYDLATQETEQINDGDGMSATNPRYLLVYDSIDENGDVQTVGYDMDKGVSVPLGAIPRAVPENIPEPDGTNEESAFVQTNPTLKDDIEVQNDDVATSTDVGGDVPPPPEDPMLSGFDLIVASTTATTDVVAVVPTHIDVIDMSVASTTVVEEIAVDIPDVVIPAFVGTTTPADAIE